MTTLTVKADNQIIDLGKFNQVGKEPVKAVITFLEIDDQEVLKKVSRSFKKLTEGNQRQIIIAKIPDFICNLVPGGRASLKDLPIQIIEMHGHVPAGANGCKAVSNIPQNKLKGSIVIGMEKNVTEEQPWRPFLAFKVNHIREARLCCMAPLIVKRSTHSFFQAVQSYKLTNHWGCYGDLPGFELNQNITEAADLSLPRQFAQGETITSQREMGPSCNACNPTFCPSTPCAFLEYPLYNTQVKLIKASE